MVDEKAIDIYAVGIILYELWYKHVPNEEDIRSSGAASHGRLQSRVLVSQTPPSLTQLMMWCYDLNPSKRPRASNNLKFFKSAVLTPLMSLSASSSTTSGDDSSSGINSGDSKKERRKSPPPKRKTEKFSRPIGTSM